MTMTTAYSADADLLYRNSQKRSHATDGALTDDGTIVRFIADEVIGFRVLHIGRREPATRLETISQ
jgi:hypothetical protein